jgi:hypothetical protein
VPIISGHPLRITAGTLLLNERGANLRNVQALAPPEAFFCSLSAVRAARNLPNARTRRQRNCTLDSSERLIFLRQYEGFVARRPNCPCMLTSGFWLCNSLQKAQRRSGELTST